MNRRAALFVSDTTVTCRHTPVLHYCGARTVIVVALRGKILACVKEKKEITAYLYFIKSRPRAKNKHQNLDLLNFLFDVRHSERYQQPLVCSALIKCRERNTLQRQRRTKISNIGAFVALNSLFPELGGEVLAQRGLPMKPPPRITALIVSGLVSLFVCTDGFVVLIAVVCCLC